MVLKDQLTADMKEAMKAKDKERLSVVRMLKASVQNEEIKLGHDLTDEEALTLLSRELKQRKDSYEEFKSAGREDLLAPLEKEICIVQTYLPEPLTTEELTSIITETISEVQAEQMSDFGKVMGAVMPKVKGRADGKEIQAIVKQQLQK